MFILIGALYMYYFKIFFFNDSINGSYLRSFFTASIAIERSIDKAIKTR